jgi:hypothetical protein
MFQITHQGHLQFKGPGKSVVAYSCFVNFITFEGFANLKLNLPNVIGVTGTVAKEIAAKQPEFTF